MGVAQLSLIPQVEIVHFFRGLLGATVSASQLTTRRSRFSEGSVMETFLRFKAKGFLEAGVTPCLPFSSRFFRKT